MKTRVRLWRLVGGNKVSRCRYAPRWTKWQLPITLDRVCPSGSSATAAVFLFAGGKLHDVSLDGLLILEI